MSPPIAELQAAIKSLKLALGPSFMLKALCKIVIEGLLVVESDLKSNEDWYRSQELFCFSALISLKKFLRFTKVHLKVTDKFPQGLGELRKARSLCNLTLLRVELNSLVSELEMILFSGPLQKRLGQQLMGTFSSQAFMEAYIADSQLIPALFQEVFASLAKLFSDRGEYQTFNTEFVESFPSNVSLEYFDSPQLGAMSYQIETHLLSMSSNTPPPFTSLEFKTENPFRVGRFGKIFVGTLGGPLPVCIQEISKNQLETLSSNGRIKLFQTLRTSISKPDLNMVKVLGVTLHQGALYVSLERVNFSLSDLLHGHNGLPPRFFKQSELLSVVSSVSSALSFLHKEGVVHGDIRPANIFFERQGQNGFVKLAMFSYELNLDELHWSTWNEEALSYQAPEILGNKQFSSAGDLYAFGITMWELSQRNRLPFDDVDRSKSDIISLIKKNERPSFSGNEPPWLTQLATQCWDENSWKRPSAAFVKSEIDEVISGIGIQPSELDGYIAATIKRREQFVDSSGPSKAPVNKVTETTAAGKLARPLPPIAPPTSPEPVPFKSPGSGISRPLPPIAEQNKGLPALPERTKVTAEQPSGHLTGATLNRIDEYNARENVHSNGTTDVETSAPNAEIVGVNGLTSVEVRQELIKFYSENDPDMLRELNDLVNWCMVNGLEEFDKLLVDRFGKGLPMYERDSGEEEANEAPPPPTESPKAARGGLASIFTAKRNKQAKEASAAAAIAKTGKNQQDTKAQKGRPLPTIPDQEGFGFDNSAPPPMPIRPKPPGL